MLVAGHRLVVECSVVGNTFPVGVADDSAPDLTAEHVSPRLNAYAVAMRERDAPQAAELIRALRELRDEMIDRMTWLEKDDRPSDAAALRGGRNEDESPT